MTRITPRPPFSSPVFRSTDTLHRQQHKPWHRTLPYIILDLLLLTLLNGTPAISGFYATSTNQLSSNNSTVPQVTLTTGIILSTTIVQTAAGPEQVSQLDIDLNSHNIRLGVVQAYNRLISPDEPLSSMANRTTALAGINGDYFEIHGPGRPIAMVEVNGHLLQSPTNYAVLGVTTSGRLTIGRESFTGSVTDGTARHTLTSVNIYNDAHRGGLVLITPELGASISVQGETVAIIRPDPASPGTFQVQKILSNPASLPCLSGQYALIGSRKAGRWLKTHLHMGDYIDVDEHISPDTDLLQAIGGGPMLIKQGKIYDDPDTPAPQENFIRDPLTAIGVTRDGTHAIFVVFNGREADAAHSKGLTHLEAAHYMLLHGAYNAMLFDSGGSSELVARLPHQRHVSVINTPSDGHERQVANGLFIYNVDPPPSASKFVPRNKLLHIYP